MGILAASLDAESDEIVTHAEAGIGTRPRVQHQRSTDSISPNFRAWLGPVDYKKLKLGTMMLSLTAFNGLQRRSSNFSRIGR